MGHLNFTSASAWMLSLAATTAVFSSSATSCRSADGDGSRTGPVSQTRPSAKPAPTYGPWQHSRCPGLEADPALLQPEAATAGDRKKRDCPNDVWSSDCRNVLHPILVAGYAACEHDRAMRSEMCIPCTLCQCAADVQNARRLNGGPAADAR